MVIREFLPVNSQLNRIKFKFVINELFYVVCIYLFLVMGMLHDFSKLGVHKG